jgi:HlyD family secretion protein
MSAPQLNLASGPSAGMDRKIHRRRWSPSGWPLGAKIGFAAGIFILIVFAAVRLIAGSGERTLRLPVAQATFEKVEHGIFHDLIPLRVSVVPRETIYIDAIDGGRIDRVLVEAGDVVQEGQPLIELSNTNLALQVIQQESQLNQAISQLQQNEIALEQDKLSNDRALAEIDYSLIRLGRSAARRDGLAVKGMVSGEERESIADELAHYRRLRPIQAESGLRQAELRERLLPDINHQLKSLRGNLAVVHDKLDSLIIRAPATGRVTAMDLKVGENRSPGQRLAEVTPATGMKLSADIDEFYLSRVSIGQSASIDIDDKSTHASVRRISPQVRNGRFSIDLDFVGASPPDLISGKAAQGRLQLGNDEPATVLAVGPFLEHTGGDWIFVLAADGKSAERRRIKIGRRTAEQLEVLAGLSVGEQVVTSDYTGFDRIDRIVLTR